MYNRQKPFKFLWTKSLSLLLAIMLVVTLIPVQPTYAAVEGINFTGLSTDQNSPTQKNTNTIDVVGTYAGVSTNTITYKVERIVNGAVASVTHGTGISPALEGNNIFRFMGVQLYEGLNKITVSGNASGYVLSNSAYVYFPNVPTIYDVQLIDQSTREVSANKPTLVEAESIVLMFKAPNTKSARVNGRTALYGGDDTYILTDFQLVNGLNTLVFTASNDTMTYSITRHIVLYTGAPTGSNLVIENASGNPAVTNLDGFPTVGPNNSSDQLVGKVKGYFFVQNQSGAPDLTNGDIVVNMPQLATQTYSTNITGVENISVTGSVYDYKMYRFETTGNVTISTSGVYDLTLTGQYGGEPFNYPIQFTFKTGSSPIINEVHQAYNVTQSGTQYNYTSSSLLANEFFFQKPIWILVKTTNFTPGTDTALLESFQNGNAVGTTIFNYTQHVTANGELLFRVNNLPEGEQTLRVTIQRSGETDVADVPINYVPTPFIELSNLYNGMNFELATQLTEITGRLINFNLSTDLSSLTISINGTVRPITNVNTTTGSFIFSTLESGSTTTIDPALRLVDGPNSIVVSGVANGVPVSTTLTVYLFSSDRPSIQSIIPVPINATADTENRFKSSADLQYTTTEKVMDVRFSVQRAKTVQVSIDGQIASTATYYEVGDTDANGNPVTSATAGWQVINENTLAPTLTPPATSTGSLPFIMNDVRLPDSGTKSVTISVMRGTTTISQTLQVTRTRLPYTLLSPKLPEESVINRNYLHVSIQAEGAEQILIGKEEMVKSSNNDDIFRLELKDLKKGNNTIKFSIFTDGNKTDHQFTVNYAAKSEVGAELKTTIPTSGKLKAFDGDLEITLPKNTLLKKIEEASQINQPAIDLFNSQQLLLAIADRNDGRTVKKYNRVNEYASGVAQDGQMGNVLMDGTASVFLRNGLTHFGYSSDLYWIDAGYFVPNSSTFATVDGMQPYASGSNRFYSRGSEKWLVPTERGTITLKYDANIRNEPAQNLSVWRSYFDEGVWKWQNLGGVVNTGKKTITASFDGFGYYAVFSVKFGFEDITGHAYARNYLDTMFAKGIMKPNPNTGLFGVYENITRGEFATMIVRMLDLPLNYSTYNELTGGYNPVTSNTFSDVAPFNQVGSMWDYRYIETAARAGIISGTAPKVFGPANFLTREQAAVIISRALNLKTGDASKEAAALAKSFVDAGSVDYYAVSYVQAVTKAGIMNGSPNPLEEGQKKVTYSFNPKSNLNRADMAIIAYNVMKKLKKL